MRDVMMDIYNLLKADDFISQHVNVIKFYEYPEVGSITEPYIIMDEIDGPLPTEYADDDPMAETELIQVDVYVTQRDGINARTLCKQLDKQVKAIIWDGLGMYNSANNKPEYDKEFNLYRRASRFEGAFYYEKN